MYKLLVSGTIPYFRDKAERTWKIERYNFKRDIFKPIVFFGMYHIGDYKNYLLHRGERIVFWAGGDINNLKRKWAFSDGKHLWLSELFSFIPWHWIFKIFKAEHYVENELEQQELKSLGIRSTIRPSFLENIEDFPVCFKPTDKPQVFLSARFGKEEEYGFGLIARLAEKVPEITFHLYGADKRIIRQVSPKNVVYHGEVPEEQFNREIRDYHSGLRTNEHDGFSEIIAKSVLMGQYPISRLKYPMIDSYKTEEELIELLKKLKDKTGPNHLARNYWQKNLNYYPWIGEMEIINVKQGYLKYNLVREGTSDSYSEFRKLGYGKEFIELVSIHIYPQFRKQGYGKKFIDVLVELAKREEINSILLMGHTDGKSDIFGKFLTKTGFFLIAKLNKRDRVFEKYVS